VTAVLLVMVGVALGWAVARERSRRRRWREADRLSRSLFAAAGLRLAGGSIGDRAGNGRVDRERC